MSRVMHALHRHGWVKRVRAVLLRRGTDPWESHESGMINTVIPETKVPSHQGPDARTVIPDLDITTLAGAGPFNLSHLHFAMVEKTRHVSVDELRGALRDAPRVAFVRADDGVVALNSVIELMRDLGRPRGDMWEVAVWEDALAADEREVYLTYQVHNEAIVVPETIDCIRALTGVSLIAYRGLTGPGAYGLAGLLLPLVSAAGSASESVLVKRADAGDTVLGVAAWQLLIGSIPLLALSAWFERGRPIAWSPPFVGLLLFLALAGTAFTTALWYWLVQRDGVGRLSLMLFLAPVLGLLLAAALFGERIGAVEVAGVALAIAGTCVVAWESMNTPSIAPEIMSGAGVQRR